MRKLFIICVSALMVMFLSGCSKTVKLTCEGLIPGDNMNAKGKMVFTFEDDKLTYANMDYTFQDITVPNLDDVWDTFKEQFEEQNGPAEDEGFVRTSSFDDKNHTYSIAIDIDYAKITDEVRDKYGVEDYQNKSYDEIKELITSDGTFTCK